jgi:hypothetical protein
MKQQVLAVHLRNSHKEMMRLDSPGKQLHGFLVTALEDYCRGTNNLICRIQVDQPGVINSEYTQLHKFQTDEDFCFKASVLYHPSDHL